MARRPARSSPRHPAPQRKRVGWLPQLIGILIAPAAWVAQMALSAMSIGRACQPVSLPLIGVSLVCFAIGVAALVVAWFSWRRSRTESAGEGKSTLDIGEGRTRFLALLSVCTNGLFLIAMLFTGSTFLLVPECQNDASVSRFTADDVAQGAYLARVGDCTSCHTAPGQPAYAGGFAIHSPLGTIYGTNITPDRTYGIGAYSLADFDRAVRKGVAKDGHHLYPAMPYTSFARMDDRDVKSLYAYFMTGVPAAHIQPPQTRLPFPLNQRWGIWFWDAVFLHKGAYVPQAGRDAQWNRGAYLVLGPGHCGGCHTPRNIAYAERNTSGRASIFLSGTDVDKWHAANLRGDGDTGLGPWSEDDIAGFLKTGHALGPQGHDVQAMGSMVQVVENSTQYMSDDDRLAIARYLKSLDGKGPSPTFTPAPAASVFEAPGAGLYAQDCASCHGTTGGGRDGVFPRLAGNPVVLSKSPTSLIHLVLAGGKPPQTEGASPSKSMPAFGQKLNDREAADVLSYIRTNFGNHAGAVTEPQVRSLRGKLRPGS